MSGPVVALLRELLQEVVAPCDADFPEGEFGECGSDEGAHVALIEQSRGAGESVFYLHVFEPIVHECGELAVGAEADEARLEERAFRELAFQGEFRGGLGRTGALDSPELPIPVAVSSTCLAVAFADLAVADLPEGANWRAGPSHADPRRNIQSERSEESLSQAPVELFAFDQPARFALMFSARQHYVSISHRLSAVARE
ncbi:hypothetical protein GCM10009693_21330 [Leucobacter chromiireducens subsp. chromiireducens]